MSTIKTKAYIPSVSEYNKYFYKFRAFMSARISEKAKENGARESLEYKGIGTYFLRSPSDYPELHHICCGSDKGLYWRKKTHLEDNGLRVAFMLKYNSESSVVKSCQEVEQQTLMFDKSSNENKTFTSKAPIVKFGGHDCIWFNKEECENGTANTMELWTLELIDKAVSFDKEGKNNDYAKATELQNQCYEALTENCTEEEKTMMVEVEIGAVGTSNDNRYEKATPILEMESQMS